MRRGAKLSDFVVRFPAHRRSSYTAGDGSQPVEHWRAAGRRASGALLAPRLEGWTGGISRRLPGRAPWGEPRIHTSDRGYGFSDVQLHIKARRFALPRNDGSEDVSRAATTFFERKAVPTGGRRTARSARSKARSARSADVHRIFNPTRRFQMRPRLRQCYDASGVVA